MKRRRALREVGTVRGKSPSPLEQIRASMRNAPESRAAKLLDRLLAQFEQLVDAVRPYPTLQHAADDFHRRKTCDDAMSLTLHAMSSLRPRVIGQATNLACSAASSQRLVTPRLPAFAAIRSTPFESNGVITSSAAAAIWELVSTFARDIERTRLVQRPAAVGDFGMGEPLVADETPEKCWEHQGKQYAAAVRNAGHDPQLQKQIVKNAQRLEKEIFAQGKAADYFWPDLAQVVALRARDVSTLELARLRDQLHHEQAQIARASLREPTSAAKRTHAGKLNDLSTAAAIVEVMTRWRNDSRLPRPRLKVDVAKQLGVSPATLLRQMRDPRYQLLHAKGVWDAAVAELYPRRKPAVAPVAFDEGRDGARRFDGEEQAPE